MSKECVEVSLDLMDASVLLVTPPPTPSVTPFGAIGYLSGALSHADIPNAKVDLGLELTRWLIGSKARNQNTLQPTHQLSVETRAGKSASMPVSELTAQIDNALPILQNPYRDRNAHEFATQLVRSTYAMFTDASPAGQMILGTYSHPWINETLGVIQRELLGQRDMLAPFLIGAAKSVMRRDYKLVAISVAHADQLLPTLGFAKALRHAGFEGGIALGGVQISFLSKEIQKTAEFFEYVDCALPKMGEAGIVALVQSAENPKSLCRLPGVIALDPDTGMPVENPGYRELDIRFLPDPDFNGLPLDQYLVPEPTLPLRTATKCYWGKCKFCRITGDEQFAAKGLLTGKALFEKMLRMIEKHGARHFVMADDATSPRTLSAMSELIIAEGLDVGWTCIGLRPEENLTDANLALWKRAGCASIAIGFESGSQRMVDIMEKGQKVETVERILRSCHNHEIITFCYGFYGHPLETEEDLRASLEFRRRNEQYASYFAAGRWLLSPYNFDYGQAAQLGIEIETPKHFPWGRDYWLEWTSPNRAAHERTIDRLLAEYGGVGGPRNYLSDWIYWGQGMHVPYDWVRQASHGAI